MNFQIYTMYVTRKDLLVDAIASVSEFEEKIVVLDNSVRQDLELEGFRGEIIKPSAPLFCSQSYNFIRKMAIERDQDLFLMMHSDAYASNDAVRRLLLRAQELTDEGRRWGVLFTDYDVLCAYNRKVVQNFLWDNFFPVYWVDIDYNRRLRLAGIEIVETDIVVEHRSGGSNSRKSDFAIGTFVNANMRGWQHYYSTKWGGDMNEETFETPFNLGPIEDTQGNPLHLYDTEALMSALKATPNVVIPVAGLVQAQLHIARLVAAGENKCVTAESHEEIDRLRQFFPYPETKPDVPTHDHGWLQQDTALTLARWLSDSTRVVVELGSWLGSSTRHIARCAPHATVISVDHWLGSEDHRADAQCQPMLPTLYETYLVNCWEYRDRIVPVRLTTLEGLALIARLGIRPDVIYIDASHDFDSVFRDVETSLRLFPDAILIGDDWNGPEIQSALREIVCGPGKEKRFGHTAFAWWLIPWK